MEVAPTEAERADRRAPGVAGGEHPGPGFGVDVERRRPRQDPVERAGDLDRRRQDLVVQGQRRLDQPRRPRRRLGVADLRLDRPQRAPRPPRPRLAVDLVQDRQLGRVADLRPRPVRLDQLDRRRRDPRQRVRLPQGLRLPRRARRVDRVPLAVARRPHRPDHRVDLVAVPPRVVQPLQDQDPQPLAQDRPVARGVERPRVARRRQRRGLAEAHVHEDVIERIEAAGEGHVAAAGGELEQGEVQGAERAGAGGVDDAVGAAEVEAVGDPAGGDVAQQAGERVLLPADVGVGDVADDPLGGVVGDAGGLQARLPDRVAEPGAQGDDQLERAGDAEDHADAVALEPAGAGAAVAVAGVLQRPARDQQAEELGRVGRLEVVGGDPELQRGEVDRREEPAPAGVGPVGRLGVGVEVVLDPPVRRRHVGDRVEPVADVGPEARQALPALGNRQPMPMIATGTGARTGRVGSAEFTCLPLCSTDVRPGVEGPRRLRVGRADRPRRSGRAHGSGTVDQGHGVGHHGLRRSSSSASSSGASRGVPAGIATPCAASPRARCRTAAPYRMFSATVTTRRFSGRSRNEPRTHSLNAAIAGPHQTW